MPFATVNRVAVYHSNRDIRIEERDLPQLERGELLLQVHASGVCGSDVMEWYRRPKAPTVLGHEVAGRIVDVSKDVRDFKVGDRIVATHHVPCLACRYCLTGRETVCEMLRQTSFDPGGFAEFIRIPRINVERGVLRLPDDVSDDAGSFVEPLGCVMRAQRTAGLETGHSVLIIGAGVSGCLHLLAARASGATRILASEPHVKRRELAVRLGADGAFDARDDVPKLVRKDLGRGADRVIVCTGASSAVDQALASVDRGGTILFFAPMGPDEMLPLPFNDVFWRNDVTLTSSYGSGPGDLKLALELIASGRIDPTRLITHRLPLGKIQAAFKMMVDAGDSLKIIIDPRLDAQTAGRTRGRDAAALAQS